ncbi:PUA domain-containing protein [Fusarium oxysporum f. sp. conglutinans race 2 54008]|uniref:PUA domain-containing protein n=2 Tax=Fusarium oxysporum TaxID=5507 RepID=X0HX05_FUSOX|nr:PUA domain-containing protein [Fusarium oxysporum f. sp. pisi HDV247]EXL76391.1 PUA domain-containing protein [Fusarium oxysporum f. sp. conglutinans race 2 54008]
MPRGTCRLDFSIPKAPHQDTIRPDTTSSASLPSIFCFFVTSITQLNFSIISVSALPLNRHNVQERNPGLTEAKAQIIRPALPSPGPSRHIPSSQPLHRRDPAQEGLPLKHEADRPQHPLRSRLDTSLLPTGSHWHPHSSPPSRTPIPSSVPQHSHRPWCHSVRPLGRYPHGPWLDFPRRQTACRWCPRGSTRGQGDGSEDGRGGAMEQRACQG